MRKLCLFVSGFAAAVLTAVNWLTGSAAIAAGIAAADARNHAFGDSDHHDGCFDAVDACVLSEHKMQKSCKKAVLEADELKFLLVRR